jgi:hypothetical protein
MLLEAARRIGLFLTTCLLTLGAPTAHQAAFASGDVNRVMTAASAARRRVGRILFSLVPLRLKVSVWEPSFHLGIFWQNFGCWEISMEQAFRQNTQVDLVEPSVPGVSWAAVLAGAVASLALTLVLLSFGAGMGFSVVSPWGNSGVSATTFKIGTGLYFIVMAMISSAIGGYLAGRLRTKWVGVQTTEVHFRDTAHGFLAWAAASVLGAVLLASPASSLVGGTLAGATQGAFRWWAERSPAPRRARPTLLNPHR